jgi:hypothetical protein
LNSKSWWRAAVLVLVLARWAATTVSKIDIASARHYFLATILVFVYSSE